MIYLISAKWCFFNYNTLHICRDTQQNIRWQYKTIVTLALVFFLLIIIAYVCIHIGLTMLFFLFNFDQLIILTSGQKCLNQGSIAVIIWLAMEWLICGAVHLQHNLKQLYSTQKYSLYMNIYKLILLTTILLLGILQQLF